MKHTSHLLFTLIVLTTLLGCNKIGNTDNPLYGKIYRDVSELPGFAGVQQVSGSVIESSKGEDGNYKFGFSYFKQKDKCVIILEEILTPNEKGEVSYKIFDTITVEHVKANQDLMHALCRKGEEYNEKLIALVSLEEKTGEYTVIKAWLVDVETGRINPLADIKGITCFSEDFEGCGEEDYEEGEAVDSLVSDTTHQTMPIDTVIAQGDSVASKQ